MDARYNHKNAELALLVIETVKNHDAKVFWAQFPDKYRPINRDTIFRWKKRLSDHGSIHTLGSARKNKKLQGPKLNERV